MQTKCLCGYWRSMKVHRQSKSGVMSDTVYRYVTCDTIDVRVSSLQRLCKDNLETRACWIQQDICAKHSITSEAS